MCPATGRAGISAREEKVMLPQMVLNCWLGSKHDICSPRVTVPSQISKPGDITQSEMGCFSLEEPVYVEKQWSHMEFRQPFQDTYIVVTAGKENTYYFYIFSTAC